jgi:peptidoglycan/LPS O-acetylase OafA/YrhL
VNKAEHYDDLELLRGLAALAVVVYHFLQAFLPPHQAPPLADAVGLTVERPFVLALVNGPFMVTIFFVLSSYALTVKLVAERAPGAVLTAMIKRFPRLFPLTLIGTLLPAAIFLLGWMFNDEVAALTRSEWLELYGGIYPSAKTPAPTIAGAFSDSVRLFDRGSSPYNSVLWTMRYELIGSLTALATALLIAGQRRPLLDVAITAVVGTLALSVHALCAICVGTVLLTKYLRHSTITFSPRTAMMLIVGGLIIGSTYKPFPEYMAMDRDMSRYVLRMDWLIHGVAAIMIFLGVRCWRHVRAPDWPVARVLGRLSFAVYVLHVPIIGSLASAIVYWLGYGWLGLTLAGLATAAATGALAWIVSGFDLWWVDRLNRAARLVLSARAAHQGFQLRGTDAP